MQFPPQALGGGCRQLAVLYGKQETPPVVGTRQRDSTHSGVMGIKLEERLKAAGVDCVLVHQDRTHPQYRSANDCLIDRLTK